MSGKYLTRVAAAFLVVAGMTGCTTGSQNGSVEIEVRAMAPGDQGGSYEVKIIGPDGDLADAQEVAVGSTYAIEGIPFGWVSVEATSGCTAKKELTSETPTLRMVVDGENCTLSD